MLSIILLVGAFTETAGFTCSSLDEASFYFHPFFQVSSYGEVQNSQKLRHLKQRMSDCGFGRSTSSFGGALLDFVSNFNSSYYTSYDYPGFMNLSASLQSKVQTSLGRDAFSAAYVLFFVFFSDSNTMGSHVYYDLGYNINDILLNRTVDLLNSSPSSLCNGNCARVFQEIMLEQGKLKKRLICLISLSVLFGLSLLVSLGFFIRFLLKRRSLKSIESTGQFQRF